MKEWTHDALAADLLDCRHAAGELAAERLRVGPGYTSEGLQLDVAGLRPSWSLPRITGYEVKVTRSDFLADLKAAKWRKYLPYVERLYFAVPKGVVDVRELPAECGLLVRHDTIWRAARIAPSRRIGNGERADFLMSMLLRLHGAPWDGPRRVHEQVMAQAAPRGEKPR